MQKFIVFLIFGILLVGGLSFSVLGYETYEVSDEDFEAGYTGELGAGDKFIVTFESEEYNIVALSIYKTEISMGIGTIANLQSLSVGDTKKFELVNDGYYDISVTLNKITEIISSPTNTYKAELTIKKIHEENLNPSEDSSDLPCKKYYTCPDGTKVVKCEISGTGCLCKQNPSSLCPEEDNDEDDEEDENGQVTKTKVTGNKTTFLPWQKRNESECPEGCKCRGAVVSCRTETGKTLTIEAGRSGNIITITIVKGEDDDEEPEDEEEDVEANTSLEIEQESRLITGGTRLKVKLSNGKKAEIKIMPDSAAERALERLRLKVCSSENNCTIELKEVPTRNENKAAYEIQAERHFKILSLFEAKARVKAQVDAETGEIIIVKKPWWAFLALEPEE